MLKSFEVLTLLKEVQFPSAYRLFERFPFSDTVYFSVQCSIDYECLSLDTIEPTKYTAIIVAFFKNDEFCEAKEFVIEDIEKNHLTRCRDCSSNMFTPHISPASRSRNRSRCSDE